MKRRALAVLVLAGCGSATPGRAIGIAAQLCGFLCGAREAADRAAGDFTGLACATEVRVRIYKVNGDGDQTSASPLAESCQGLTGSTKLFDVFTVSDGIPGGVPASTGRPVTVSTAASGRVVAEVALYAPGSPACPADGNFVSLGRSAVVDVAAVDKIAVPLGCHPTCEGSAVHAVTVSLRDFAGAARASIPQSALGEIYGYGGLYATAGQCAEVVDPGVVAAEFRPFDGGTVQPNGTATATYGIDSSKFGGCVAIEVPTQSTKTYACLDNPTTSPVGYLVPDADVQAVLAANARGGVQAPTRGTLVLQVVDEQGNPVVGADVIGASSFALYPDPQWTITENPTSTGTTGIAVVPDAQYGEYRVFDASGANNAQGAIALGGGPVGTITTARVVVHPR